MATRKAAVAVKAPKGPDELLKSAIKKLDITQSNAAELMGMQVQNLHRYLTGERRVTAKLAKRAEKYLGSEVISATMYATGTITKACWSMVTEFRMMKSKLVSMKNRPN
jgi:transcriptional regulator with XRE-family HTH domain